jgi:hypothetical protein
MKLTLHTVGLYSLIVVIAYAPTFLLAGSIDGDEWVKSGAGALGLALVALLAKILPPYTLPIRRRRKPNAND